jgi:hypothetical protein
LADGRDGFDGTGRFDERSGRMFRNDGEAIGGEKGSRLDDGVTRTTDSEFLKGTNFGGARGALGSTGVASSGRVKSI